MSSLRGILSDTSNIISSILLHFATLYLLSVFPTSIFDALIQLPSPFYTVVVDHSNSQIPSIDKSQLLYGLALLLFNISFVSSVTSAIFRGFHRKLPFKLYPSTKLAYSIISVAILSALAICTALVFYLMILPGMEVEAAASKCFAALLVMTLILFSALFAYLCVEWCFMDAIFDEEYDLERVTEMRGVAFAMITMLGIMQGILSALNSVLAGRGKSSDDVVSQLAGYDALFAVLSLFCFVHCKAFNGELEDLESDYFYFPGDENKLRQIKLLGDKFVDKGLGVC